jgi:ABC-type glycerol-3-phosphate transport system substrate-binding protein
MRKFLSVLLLLLLPMTALLAGPAAEASGAQEIIELSATVYHSNQLGMQNQLDNPNNVITPYITEKFGLKVTELREVPADMTWPQALVMWKAAKTVPDIMQCGAEDYGALVVSDVFAPLDGYLEGMPNYARFLPKNIGLVKPPKTAKPTPFTTSPVTCGQNPSLRPTTL